MSTNKIRQAIDEFLVAGKQAGWAPTTQVKYKKFLTYFVNWLESQRIETLEQLDRHSLRQWGAGIRDRWRPETVTTAVRVVRRWLRWCHAEGWLPPLADAIQSPRLPRQSRRTVTPEEVQKLLRVCDEDPNEVLGRRNAAIVSLLFDSMLRASELVSLDVNDLDLDECRVIVLGKGGIERPAFFSEATKTRIQRWLEVHPDHPALFTVGQGDDVRRMPYGTLYQLIVLLGERAGIPRVSPHAFRRGGACAAFKLGASTRVVMVLGGWRTLDMVVRYTQALKPDELFPQYAPMSAVKPDENE